MNRKPRDHEYGTGLLTRFLVVRSFQAIPDEGCDVFGWRFYEGQVQCAFCEYERSNRNLLRNAQRNLSKPTTGKVSYLIAVPNERLRSAARRELRLLLPEATARRFAIVLLDKIERYVARNS